MTKNKMNIENSVLGILCFILYIDIAVVAPSVLIQIDVGTSRAMELGTEARHSAGMQRCLLFARYSTGSRSIASVRGHISWTQNQ